jgi:hypothetical protein
MRRWVPAVCLLLAAGCGPAPGLSAGGVLLVSGGIDLSGSAAAVAAADPEGTFRDIRLVVREADLAVAAAAPPEASALIAAGFDITACTLPGPTPGADPAQPAYASAAGARAAVLCVADPPGPGFWALLRRARLGADLVVAVVSGAADPPLAERLARRGVDVVVVLSGSAPAAEVVTGPAGRPALVVSGLGDLLSSELPAPGGGLVEVLWDSAGVTAYRLGTASDADLRVHLTGWDPPAGDAVLLRGEWWSLARPVRPATAPAPPEGLAFTYGDLTALAVGDVTGDGQPDLAASYRHPRRPSLVDLVWLGAARVDSLGRTAHLGIFDLTGKALWAASRLPQPVGALAACDGSVALAFTGPDDPEVLATGAAVWDGLSLRSALDLPGPGIPGCADVDGDGRLDPVITGRAP